ncbi:MAG: mechanosensitive ion channel family protein [Cytophagaceae bacterium]
MNDYTEISEIASGQLYNLLIFSGSALAGLIAGTILFNAAKLFLKEIKDASLTLINRQFRFALQILFVVAAMNLALPFTTWHERLEFYIHKILYIALVLSFSFLMMRITGFIKALLYIKFDITSANNLSERKARTQIDFLQKLTSVIIFFIALAIILMSFDRVRELGTSILASAGIAGIIIGFAAQKSLSNLLAGFQIAFTQPIRIDDVVVVENEWGRIEEITLTYVVVRIWDMRRLILPISYFIERPFQNWTRASSDILGSVFLFTDYTLPIEELRNELKRILENDDNGLWDKNVGIIQVTDTTDKCMQLRVLVSANSSSNAWDLRCIVREKLITFIQKSYPGCLPKNRNEVKQIIEN